MLNAVVFRLSTTKTRYRSRLFQAVAAASTRTDENIISSSSSSSSSISERVKQEALLLLDERILPAGRYTPSHIAEAKRFLDLFNKKKTQLLTPDAELVNLSIRLVERLVKEAAVTIKDKQPVIKNWFIDERYLANILNNWKEVAINAGQKVVSPSDLIAKFQKMSLQLPNTFRYNKVTIGIIMDVVIKSSPTNSAPLAAEGFLEFLKHEAQSSISHQNKNLDIAPNTFIYGQVLHAWAVSGRPEAGEKMETILQQMRQEGVAANTVCYSLLLRYYARKVAPEKLESLLTTMRTVDGLIPDINCISQALFGFAQAGWSRQVEELFTEMERLEPQNEHEVRHFGEGVHHILSLYRRILDSDANYKIKQLAVERAEDVYQRIQSRNIFESKSWNKIVGNMMTMYACAGQYDKAEKLFLSIQLDLINCNILIQTYGKENAAERGTFVLQAMLQSSHVHPDVRTFNILLNAWAESSRSDAFEQALSIFLLLENDPKCIQLKLKPDAFTFGSLLKCLSKLKRQDAAQHVETILSEMERRRQSEGLVVSNAPYNLAIKTYLSIGELDKANSLLDRIEKSDTQSNIRTYNDIMLHWAKTGTFAAAERVEKILEHMKLIAQTKNSALTPTIHSYAIVLDAWAKSGDPSAGERMWRLYKQMEADRIEPNQIIYTTIIRYLSSLSDQEMITRADSLLKSMESCNRRGITADYRHFVPVLKKWIECGKPELAENVLLRWIEAAMKGKERVGNIEPVHFETIALAWIQAGKLDRATDLIYKIQHLFELKKLEYGAYRGTLTKLQKAWKYSSHPERAVHLETLKIMELRNHFENRGLR